MNGSSILREAAAALRFNRQRSVLTIVSLAWGIACFVILYAYGEGFGIAVTKSFEAVGQDLILMFDGQTSTQAGGERSGRKIKLEREDASLIRENVPMVVAVSAEVLMHDAMTVRGYRQQNITIRGVEPSYGKIRNMTLSSGRWISPEDDVTKQRVAVIGAKAAEKLFGDIPPDGETEGANLELQHSGQ